MSNSYLYPRQKILGFFLIAISITVFLSILVPYQNAPNAALFGLCYSLSIGGVMFNPKVRKRFSVGESTQKQKFMSNLSLSILILGVIAIMNLCKGNIRLIWLLLFAMVGLHFFLFIPVHGKLIGILGLLLIINAIVGIALPALPLTTFFIVDGFVKLIFGILYTKVSPINW